MPQLVPDFSSTNCSSHIPPAPLPEYSFSDHCIAIYAMVQERDLQAGFFF